MESLGKYVVLGAGLVLGLMSSGALAADSDPDSAPQYALFGSTESFSGLARTQLSPQRYQRLVNTGGFDDPAIAKKWSIIVHLLRWQTPENKLKLVQQFFNTLPYESDEQLYHKQDYWASVGEFMSHGGDCEDYVIAKYRALVEGGFPEGDMRLVLLEDRISGAAHAVLAVSLNRRIYILDNQRADVVDDRAIGHYRPLYSINAEYVWRHSPQDVEKPLSDIAIATRGK